MEIYKEELLTLATIKLNLTLKEMELIDSLNPEIFLKVNTTKFSEMKKKQEVIGEIYKILTKNINHPEDFVDVSLYEINLVQIN